PCPPCRWTVLTQPQPCASSQAGLSSVPMGELRERRIEWAALALTQGEVLDAFARHCEELDDVEVLDQAPTKLTLSWRGRERGAVELTGAVPAAGEPTLCLTELTEELVERFLADPALRSQVAAYDLAALQKVNGVRSSLFVHFEWFLRDVYGVKVLPAPAFTQGLVERG